MASTINQISVFVENKPGCFANLTRLLGENSVNMRAFSVAEARDFGVVRIIVDDPYNAARVLKDANYVVALTPVIAIEIPDEPGGLLNVLNVLGEENVNVDYMYAFIAKKKDAAYVIIRVDDNDKISEILGRRGIRQLDQEQLTGM